MSESNLKQFTEHVINPYLKNICDKNIIKKRDGSKMVPTSIKVQGQNGDHVGSAYIKQQTSKFIDSREFVRITDEGIKMMSNLKFVELRIFTYILGELEHNKLEIELSPKKILNHFKYTSRNPIYQGIAGLLENDIISRKQGKDPIYFINPIYFYKGTIVKEIVTYMNLDPLPKKEESLSKRSLRVS